MKKQILITFLSVFSVFAKADTALDGLWQLDRSQGISCDNGRVVDQKIQNEFFDKYENNLLFLTAMNGWWVLPTGEQISIELEESDYSGRRYTISRPGTTISDIELYLPRVGYVDSTHLEYRSEDYEWNLCKTGVRDNSRFMVKYKYLQLNP